MWVAMTPCVPRSIPIGRASRAGAGKPGSSFTHSFFWLKSTSIRRYSDFMDVGEVLSEAKHPLARSIAG